MNFEEQERLRSEITELVERFCETNLPRLIEEGVPNDEIVFNILESQIAQLFKNHGALPDEYAFMLPS